MDIKHEGYIVLEPSSFEGKSYVFETDDDPASAPDWLPRRRNSRERPAEATSVDAGLKALDRALAAANIMRGERWHDNIIRLVASYVARGLSDPEIHAITETFTLAGYTVEQTRQEVQAAIDGARRKGWSPATNPTQAPARPIPATAPFQSWAEIDPLSIKPRDFIYGTHYIRRFASITVAPAGLGKSTLVLAECVATATGRSLLGVQPKRKYRVVYFNAEDPLDEIQRRVMALCQHHGIDQAELVGQLFIASGRDEDLIFSRGEAGNIVEGVFDLMQAYQAEHQIDVFVFDPLANMTESPETNEVFRLLGKRLSKFAELTDTCIMLVHHTRKLNGKEAEVEDSRGGSALIAAVRAARALNPMTSEEAEKAGLKTHVDHFRVEAVGKTNLSRPSEHTTWYRRVDTELPNSDHVASLERWLWPDAFDGISPADTLRVQRAIADCEEPPRASRQAANWVGRIVAEELGLDAEDKADRARISRLIKIWLSSNVLRVEHISSKRNGRYVPVVLAGTPFLAGA